MIENSNKMNCGNCGGDSFKIYQEGKLKHIHVECENCKSTSIITITPAKLRIDWGENSDGILCVMPEAQYE